MCRKSNETSHRDSLWVTDKFAKTRTMSTYLVAFAVTNFESRSDGDVSMRSHTEMHSRVRSYLTVRRHHQTIENERVYRCEFTPRIPLRRPLKQDLYINKQTNFLEFRFVLQTFHRKTRSGICF